MRGRRKDKVVRRRVKMKQYIINVRTSGHEAMYEE